MKRLNIWNKYIFFLVSLVLSFMSMSGQENDIAKKKMIEIKLDEEFIFGEGVSDDKELAYGVALDDLLNFANELKNMNSQEQININDLITNVETIVYKEGSRYEVMVYIPFKIVIETNRQTSSAKNEIKKIGKETPEIETLAVPANVDTFALNNTKKEIKPQPSQEGLSEKGEYHASNTSNIKSEAEINLEVEEFLITQENFSEIKSYLSEMKRTGKIKETGAVEVGSVLPEDTHLILIDEYGGILSILSPLREGERINYKTKKSDSDKNYNSKFIVWYKK